MMHYIEISMLHILDHKKTRPAIEGFLLKSIDSVFGVGNVLAAGLITPPLKPQLTLIDQYIIFRVGGITACIGMLRFPCLRKLLMSAQSRVR